MGSMRPAPVWGRLTDVEAGAVHRLELPAVTVGRKDANKATILCEGRANRAGQHFCSAVQFELRHRDGKTWAVDMSANGTFLNIDEDAAARAFKTHKQELAWLKEQNPDPRLAKGEGQEIFDGDQLYFRLSHDRTKLTKFIFCQGPGSSDSDTSDGEEAKKRVAPRRQSAGEKPAHEQPAHREEDDGEEDWAPLPDLSKMRSGQTPQRHVEQPSHRHAAAPCNEDSCAQDDGVLPSPNATLSANKRGKQVASQGKAAQSAGQKDGKSHQARPLSFVADPADIPDGNPSSRGQLVGGAAGSSLRKRAASAVNADEQDPVPCSKFPRTAHGADHARDEGDEQGRSLARQPQAGDESSRARGGSAKEIEDRIRERELREKHKEEVDALEHKLAAAAGELANAKLHMRAMDHSMLSFVLQSPALIWSDLI